MLGSAINSLVNATLRRSGRAAERAAHRHFDDLRGSQQALLLSILQRHAGTEFGREHGFADIRSAEDYRQRVPVSDYETLRPYIERQDRTGAPALMSDTPIFYAVTSGTTGEPKYIPVHARALKAHRQSTHLFLYNLYKERPRMFAGKILAIVSPAVEGHMEGSGLPFGSTSGHIYESLSGFVKRVRYVIPSAVFGIGDYDLKYLTILRLALQERDITYLTTANPSTIARLVRLLPEALGAMTDDIARGRFGDLDRLDARTRDAVAERLRPDPARAGELARLLANTATPAIRDLWPDLQAIGTWTGGSCSMFIGQLEGQFPGHTLVRDLGYLSSEFRGSVPVRAGTNAGLPTCWSNYFEFVAQRDWDEGQARFLGLHELEDHATYYVFVTTDYGLYRYHMNDIVQVDGDYRGAPMIRFIQKGKGVTSITGEKLYEQQVIEAVSRLDAELGAHAEFYLMTCNPADAVYTLYYELSPAMKDAKLARHGARALEECRRFQARLDDILGEVNLEYAAKRGSGRLKPVRVCILKRGAYEHFKRFHLARGQREGQFKIVALQLAEDVAFDFGPVIGWDSHRSDEDNLRLLASTRHGAPPSSADSS